MYQHRTGAQQAQNKRRSESCCAIVDCRYFNSSHHYVSSGNFLYPLMVDAYVLKYTFCSSRSIIICAMCSTPEFLPSKLNTHNECAKPIEARRPMSRNIHDFREIDDYFGNRCKYIACVVYCSPWQRFKIISQGTFQGQLVDVSLHASAGRGGQRVQIGCRTVLDISDVDQAKLTGQINIPQQSFL